jgi:HEAT repeat protein
MKGSSVRHILAGVGIGVVILAGGLWVLTHTLGNVDERLYAGKPLSNWKAQLSSRDPGASNEAFSVVSGQIIPQLTDAVLHDTNDSSLRLVLVDALNALPGVRIYFIPAFGRRIAAARQIGELGPVAKSAVPILAETLRGNDTDIREAVIIALGKIHSDPDRVIPLLISCLDDDRVTDEAATALGNYGSVAKAAVPKLIPLVHAPDPDTQAAARNALLSINAEAAARAGGPTN